MITESFYKHKEYIIRLRMVTGQGAGYTIFKEFNGKKISLRQEIWNFQKPEILINRAINYIDNFSQKLEQKYLKIIS